MSDNIDKAAHDLMNFKPQKVTRVHGYEVFYHEERLYTVRDSNTGITSLVYAREPREAAEKVIKMTVPQEMSAIEYLKVRERMASELGELCSACHCEGKCWDCPYHTPDTEDEMKYPDRSVALVEKWAEEHPEERSKNEANR